MTILQVLRPEQRAQWMDVLKHSYQHDFYHLPQYHALSEEQEDGRARLFLFREGCYSVAIPLLLRPIEAVPCHARKGEGWWDATCVYGYAGPIASHSVIPASVLQDFQTSLRETLLEQRVVSVFSRLHPLIAQSEWVRGLGKCESLGRTVSIDLTLPVDVQQARYRKGHKYDVNKLRRLGVTCVRDQNWTHLDEFIDIYYETMRRVQASDAYFFDRRYFEGLISALGLGIQLFVCVFEGQVVCGGLFTLCDGIVQYHLSGSRSSLSINKWAPTKLLVDTVRLWANDNATAIFHLGGGVGSKEDSLFEFKAGFSDRRHEFTIWRWVLLPEIYDKLCEEKERWSRRYGLSSVGSGYFPEYRCPDCPCIEAGLRKEGCETPTPLLASPAGWHAGQDRKLCQEREV